MDDPGTRLAYLTATTPMYDPLAVTAILSAQSRLSVVVTSVAPYGGGFPCVIEYKQEMELFSRVMSLHCVSPPRAVPGFPLPSKVGVG